MKKTQSLILLIKSLSKSEKKHILLQSGITQGEKSYIFLFDLVDKEQITDTDVLQQQFSKKYALANFHPTVSYLYYFILDVLAKIQANSDADSKLMTRLLAIQHLKERNLFREYFNELQTLKEKAIELSNYHILLKIQRLELDFLRENDFEGITENEELFDRHNAITETLKIIRQINDQAGLYELLLWRLTKSKNYLNEDPSKFNDLVMTELSLTANLKNDVPDINRLHQLFQSQYFLAIGDFNSALSSFKALETHSEYLSDAKSNNPSVYIDIIKGILNSLIAIKSYDEIEYFISKLDALSQDSSSFYKQEIEYIKFIYPFIKYLNDDIIQAEEFYNSYLKQLDKWKENMPLFQDSIVSYLKAVLFIHKKDFSKARKQITHVINTKNYNVLPTFRITQHLNLIIHYELKDYELIHSRIRSIKRVNKMNKFQSDQEDVLFRFLQLDNVELKNDSIRNKLINSIKHLENEKQYTSSYKQMLSFDINQWILNHLL